MLKFVVIIKGIHLNNLYTRLSLELLLLQNHLQKYGIPKYYAPTTYNQTFRLMNII